MQRARPAAPERTGGNLTVESPPRRAPTPGGVRLRTDTIGPLSLREKRRWAGREVPLFVPLTSGTRELFILDLVGDQYMGLYRDPYGATSCTLDSDPKATNCAFEARLFDCDGHTTAAVDLNTYFQRTTGLELQDIRFADGVLYFNEACPSYAREQGGKCSALLAVDVASRKLLWRTPSLTSNNVFLVAGDYLITGYGFTAEPSSLFIVRRSDGHVMATQPIHKLVYPGGNHDALTLIAPDLLEVGLYEHPDDLYVEIVGLAGKAPHFGRLREPPAITPN